MPAESALAAIGSADVVLVEADACSPDQVVASMGSGLAVALAATTHTPVWLVAGRGRRLPEPYRVAMERLAGGGASRAWESEVESFPVASITRVAGPDGVAEAVVPIVPECPFVPELIPPDS